MSIIFVFLLFAKQYAPVSFCDCDTVIGKDGAKSIFEGTVMSVNRIDSDFVRYEIGFAIDNKIKGRIKGRKIIVNVPCLMDGCCGVAFSENTKYVVYTFVKNGLLYTNGCTLTKPISN
jgi:hypothetical protein